MDLSDTNTNYEGKKYTIKKLAIAKMVAVFDYRENNQRDRESLCYRVWSTTSPSPSPSIAYDDWRNKEEQRSSHTLLPGSSSLIFFKFVGRGPTIQILHFRLYSCSISSKTSKKFSYHINITLFGLKFSLIKWVC